VIEHNQVILKMKFFIFNFHDLRAALLRAPALATAMQGHRDDPRLLAQACHRMSWDE